MWAALLMLGQLGCHAACIIIVIIPGLSARCDFPFLQQGEKAHARPCFKRMRPPVDAPEPYPQLHVYR